MKLLIVYLHPEQLPGVKKALLENQIKNFSAMTVMGTASKSEQQMFRGVAREVTLFNRTRLEIGVRDSWLERAIEAIRDGASETGGAGKIFVVELTDVIEIAGERGSRAL